MRAVGRALLFPLLAAGVAGLVAPASFDPVVFEEAAAARGVRFVTNSGRTPRKHQPETMVAGVALFDYNNDGWLDIYAVNGAKMTSLDKTGPEYWNPLFRNNGDGTFTDVSAASGIRAHVGKGMGIGVADFDDDGWPDLFVSNDTVPSFLFMNNRNGTFTESAFERAVAFTERAEAVSGMGADARDVDNDGRPDIFQTALSNETFPLFKNLGGATFEEVTARSGVGMLSRGRSGWGNGIVDLNNDGWK